MWTDVWSLNCYSHLEIEDRQICLTKKMIWLVSIFWLVSKHLPRCRVLFCWISFFNQTICAKYVPFHFFCIPNFHTLTMCWYRKIITLSSECAHVLVLVCFRYIPAWYCCVESSFLYQTEARRHQFGRFVCFSLASLLVLRRICWYPAHFDSHLKFKKKTNVLSLVIIKKRTWNVNE